MLPAQHERLSGPALGVIKQFWSYCIWTIKGSRNTGVFLNKEMIFLMFNCLNSLFTTLIIYLSKQDIHSCLSQ